MKNVFLITLLKGFYVNTVEPCNNIVRELRYNSTCETVAAKL